MSNYIVRAVIYTEVAIYTIPTAVWLAYRVFRRIFDRTTRL